MKSTAAAAATPRLSPCATFATATATASNWCERPTGTTGVLVEVRATAALFRGTSTVLAPPRVAPATAPRSIATVVPGRREAGPHTAGETFYKQTTSADQVKMTPNKMTPFGPGELNLALRIRLVLVSSAQRGWFPCSPLARQKTCRFRMCCLRVV